MVKITMIDLGVLHLKYYNVAHANAYKKLGKRTPHVLVQVVPDRLILASIIIKRCVMCSKSYVSVSENSYRFTTMKPNSFLLCHYACCNCYILVLNFELNRSSMDQLVADLKSDYGARFPEGLKCKEMVRNAVTKNIRVRQKKSQWSYCKKHSKLNLWGRIILLTQEKF